MITSVLIQIICMHSIVMKSDLKYTEEGIHTYMKQKFYQRMIYILLCTVIEVCIEDDAVKQEIK